MLQKTVRFAHVVQRCGQPRVHALWVAPEKDAEFTQARKANRIMTVRPGASGKADVGQVGYDPPTSLGGQFLIFPKSLSRFANTRVVGLKFDLIDQPPLSAADPHAVWAPPRTRAHMKTKVPRESPSEEPVASQPQSAPVNARNRRTPPTQGRRSTNNGRGSAGEPNAKRNSSSSSPDRSEKTPTEMRLRREIHAALRELKAGKAVAAYQRLERVAGD